MRARQVGYPPWSRRGGGWWVCVGAGCECVVIACQSRGLEAETLRCVSSALARPLGGKPADGGTSTIGRSSITRSQRERDTGGAWADPRPLSIPTASHAQTGPLSRMRHKPRPFRHGPHAAEHPVIRKKKKAPPKKGNRPRVGGLSHGLRPARRCKVPCPPRGVR